MFYIARDVVLKSDDQDYASQLFLASKSMLVSDQAFDSC